MSEHLFAGEFRCQSRGIPVSAGEFRCQRGNSGVTGNSGVRASFRRRKAGREAESGTKRDGGGKRDGYDIDKMGSFGLWFGDATYSAVAPGGMVFHVLNRGVARMQLFEKAADYQAFEQVLRDTLDQSPMRICAYAVMPNHWHLLLWPECDGELAAFMQRLTITHVRRWQEHRGYAGLGHVYQGRYKSFPVESDEHFWVVARYVERNALAPISSCERRNGGGQACGNAVIHGRRAVVVGGVADRYASELARAGQSNRRRAGTGSVSPERATRPPLWPAGMAEGNRATFGPRVGLSSHGSPAKGGPKSKCLARVKIAQQTSAGPPSLTISDPSRSSARGRMARNGVDQDCFQVRRSGLLGRDLAAWLVRHHSSATLRELAPIFGLNHPDSVNHLVRRVDRALARSSELREDIGMTQRLEQRRHGSS